jgi:hypothetical protein
MAPFPFCWLDLLAARLENLQAPMAKRADRKQGLLQLPVDQSGALYSGFQVSTNSLLRS